MGIELLIALVLGKAGLASGGLGAGIAVWHVLCALGLTGATSIVMKEGVQALWNRLRADKKAKDLIERYRSGDLDGEGLIAGLRDLGY